MKATIWDGNNPEPKTLAITIEENGDLTFIASDAADVFLECGQTVTQRASHVEPATLWLRVWFHILRSIWGRKTQVAQWTRGWKCLWRVNTKPVGGPILRWHHAFPEAPWVAPAGDGIATWADRQEAIDAEIKFLNEWFAVR